MSPAPSPPPPPRPGGRFGLVTLDLDGTLLPHDTAFAAVLRENGKAAEAAASDARHERGESTLEACFWEQWALVRELTLADCHRALRKAAWLPGIAEGVGMLRRAGLSVTLLTDQPTSLTDFLGRWGLVDAVASPVTVKDGRPIAIDARFDKLANLRSRLRGWGLPVERACHVGNGPNDVPVFQAAGGSVAVFPAEGVAEAAHVVLPEPRDLIEVAEAVLRLHAQDG